MAEAFAAVQASATAIAEAHARAAAAATAAAEAYASAQTAANAAASAAASADTSVSVMSDVHSSTKTLIDPDCMSDMCQEYQPRPEQQPSQCAEPEQLEWDFGEVRGGMRIISTKSFPYEVGGILQGFDIVSANQMSSDLPGGVTFSIDTNTDKGTLQGTLPTSPTTYHVVYGFVDANNCNVVVLHISIEVSGGGQEQPGQACGRAIASQWNYGDVKGGTIHFLTARQIPTNLQYQINSAGVVAANVVSSTLPEKAQFNLDLNNHIGTLTGYIPAQSATYQVVFALSDQSECEVIRLTVLLTVKGETGGNPPSSQTSVCAHVTAVVASSTQGYSSMATPTLTMQYTEIAVKMAVNGHLQRTTPYDLCGSAGTQFTIQAQADFWTQKEEHFIFKGWQTYNEQTKQWVPFSNDQRIVQNPILRIILQNGGSLRGVYQQGEQG